MLFQIRKRVRCFRVQRFTEADQRLSEYAQQVLSMKNDQVDLSGKLILVSVCTPAFNEDFADQFVFRCCLFASIGISSFCD